MRFSFANPSSSKVSLGKSSGKLCAAPPYTNSFGRVGKTSVVVALANAIGMPLTRLNLSEQTDIMDLFGSDIPVDGGHVGQFAWRDAPFLKAMKKGEWVLLGMLKEQNLDVCFN